MAISRCGKGRGIRVVRIVTNGFFVDKIRNLQSRNFRPPPPPEANVIRSSARSRRSTRRSPAQTCSSNARMSAVTAFLLALSRSGAHAHARRKEDLSEGLLKVPVSPRQRVRI